MEGGKKAGRQAGRQKGRKEGLKNNCIKKTEGETYRMQILKIDIGEEKREYRREWGGGWWRMGVGVEGGRGMEDGE